VPAMFEKDKESWDRLSPPFFACGVLWMTIDDTCNINVQRGMVSLTPCQAFLTAF
jgi:hypothetical protein